MDIRACGLATVRAMVEAHHGYGSCGTSLTYAFAVYEEGRPVAVFAWQPPPPGAAKSVCPEAPGGVLSLSRMVALPRSERHLRHISKPLRVQMRRLIDRTRWPVLVTYSDEGQGHTGHVYKCSGWRPTMRALRPVFVDCDGNRASSYAGGRHGSRDLRRVGRTTLQRWEHWACLPGAASEHMTLAGWRNVPIVGKTWRSGRQAYCWVRTA